MIQSITVSRNVSKSQWHVQVRSMSNFGLKGGILWLVETDGSLCFTCREDDATLCYFFFDCPTFKPNFHSLWCNLPLKASNLNASDGTQISQSITSLYQFHKTLLLLGCLRLPFDNREITKWERRQDGDANDANHSLNILKTRLRFGAKISWINSIVCLRLVFVLIS